MRILKKMNASVALNYGFLDDSGAEKLSITFELPDRSSSSLKPIKVQERVAETEFTVSFSFFLLVSKNVSFFQEKKNGEWVQSCTWFFDRNSLKIVVDSSGFQESQVMNATENLQKDDCCVFSVPKPIMHGVQSMLKVYAPQGYLAKRRKLLRQSVASPSPLAFSPSLEIVTLSDPGVISEASGSTLRTSTSPSPAPLSPRHSLQLPHSGFQGSEENSGINFLSSPFLRCQGNESIFKSFSKSDNYAGLPSVSCTPVVDDHNRSDVVVSLPLPATGVIERTGNILNDIFYKLAVFPAGSLPISRSIDLPDCLSEEKSYQSGELAHLHSYEVEGTCSNKEIVYNPSWNVQAVLTFPDSLSEPLELAVHFDSTLTRPGTIFSCSFKEQSVIQGCSVVVAACKHLRCGDFFIDFLALRPTFVPSEEVIYEGISEICASGVLPHLASKTLDQYVHEMELRHSHIFKLSEEEIDSFQMSLWSALRQFILKDENFFFLL